MENWAHFDCWCLFLGTRDPETAYENNRQPMHTLVNLMTHCSNFPPQKHPVGNGFIISWWPSLSFDILIVWYFNIKNISQNLPTTTFALERALFSTIINKLLIPNTIKVNFLIPGLVSGQGGGKATPPIIRLTPRQWDLPIDSKVQQYYLRFWLSLGEPGKRLHNVWLFVCVRYCPSYPRGCHY